MRDRQRIIPLMGGRDLFRALLKETMGSSLLAYYPLAKDGRDYSGNGYHGVASNVVFDGQKATFNGSTSVISIAAIASVITTGEMTVFCRAQLTDAAIARIAVYSQYSFADGRFDIRATATAATPTIYYTMPAPATDYGPAGTVGSAVNRNTYALTASLTGDKVQAYINGAALGAGATGLQAWGGPPAAVKCCIGASDNGTPTAVWQGTIDHVVIANVAMTPAQVAALNAFFS